MQVRVSVDGIDLSWLLLGQQINTLDLYGDDAYRLQTGDDTQVSLEVTTHTSVYAGSNVDISLVFFGSEGYSTVQELRGPFMVGKTSKQTFHVGNIGKFQVRLLRYYVYLARPMSCMQEVCDVIKYHTVGFQTNHSWY